MKAHDLAGPGDEPAPAETGGDPACWLHLLDHEVEEPAMTDRTTDPTDPTVATVDDAVLAQVLRSTGDGVVIADRDGTIVFWNHGAERIFGWPAAEAVGRNLSLIIPERHRRAHDEGYARVMQTGVTKYADDLLQVPALHRSGERRSIAFTVSMVTHDDGTVRAIAAVIRDETERRAQDRDLRARIAELEARAGS